jgi:agmatinase
MGIRTFLGVPYEKNIDSIEARAVVVGIPYDSGVSNRPGTRFGPEAIRRSSLMLCEDFPCSCVDLGDLFTQFSESPEAMFSEVTLFATRLLEKKLFPLFLGGDHSITLPLLRAYRNYYGKPIVLFHLDAHPDTWEDIWGMHWGHGNFLYHAIREGLIDEKKSLLAGIRCPMDSATYQFTKDHIGCVVSAEEIHQEGWKKVEEHLRQLGEDPTYFTFDIDILDPAFAPGTGTPEIGGLASWQLLSLLKNPLIKKINWVGMDMVEVAPPYDHAEITSLTAASCIYYFLQTIEDQLKAV